MPDAPIRKLIDEERTHQAGTIRAQTENPATDGGQAARGHADAQVRLAVTIGHYEQVIDAALLNLDLDRLFPELLGRIRAMLDADTVTVFLPEGADLVARASVGLEAATLKGIRFPMGAGVAGHVYLTGESQTAYDIRTDTVANLALLELGIRSLVAVRIHVASQVIGVLTAGCRSGREFHASEIRLMEVVGERVGIAIERIRTLKEAQTAREQAERANRFKTTLLHMASHDIKTPLTTMKMQLRMLQTTGLSPAAHAKSIAMMDRNVTRMELLLDDFLDLARVEAGRFALRLKPIDLRGLADEVVAMYEASAEASHLTLTVQGAPVVVDADERRLMQVLVNVVSNAIRYTARGSVQVTVASDVDGGEIHIQDTGRGMTPQQIQCLFQPFGQVHEGPQEGSGLGLYLSKVIADAHGGSITVQSAGPESGTTVVVRIPIHRRAPPASAPT
jgi:signal transduction histidine kinase